MNIREEIKQDMYDLMVGSEGSKVEETYKKAVSMIREHITADREDDIMSALYDLEVGAFMEGVDMTLAFITGKLSKKGNGKKR